MNGLPLSWLAPGLGLLVGSFLNVCIHRLPRGESIVTPPSACPGCRRRIRWHDNIPVLSYLLLRGRCRDCRAAISPRYPLVEATSGVLFWLAAAMAPDPLTMFVQWALVSALLVVALIDLDHQIIPDAITLPGAVLGLAVMPFAGFTPWHGLLGALAGGGSLYLTAWGYRRLTGVEGMGMGDVKLMAMVGAFVGVKGALTVIFLGSAAGAVVGAALLGFGRAHRRTALPFGTFLAPAAVLVVLAGSRIATAWWLPAG